VRIPWIVLLPLGIIVAVFVLQRLRLVSIALTVAALAAMIFLATRYGRGFSSLILGRSFGLSTLEVAGLATCCFLVLFVVVYSYHVPEGDLSYTLVLAAMVLLSAATMMRNLAIGALLLQIGVILAAMLIPSSQPRSSMAGMRALTLLMLVGPCFLVASWALESQAADPGNTLFTNLGSILLAIGFTAVLPTMPFHIWMPPVFKYSTPLAVVACAVILNIVAMLRIYNLLFVTSLPGGQEYLAALLLGSGLITAVVVGLAALPQRSLHRTLALTAVSEGGLALASLAVGTELGARAALLHTLYRGVAVTAMAMVVGTFRRTLGGDDPEHLRGALRRTPLAVCGMVVAGLSLIGLPPMAGFTTRFMIYRVLGERDPLWAMLALAASAGPALALIRCMVSALTPVPAEGARWIEPILTGVLILVLCIPLVVLGIRPELISLPVGP